MGVVTRIVQMPGRNLEMVAHPLEFLSVRRFVANQSAKDISCVDDVHAGLRDVIRKQEAPFIDWRFNVD